MNNELPDSEKKKITKLFESFKTKHFDKKDYEKVVGNENKLRSMFSKDALRKYADDFTYLISMIKDYFSGNYTRVPWVTIACILGTLIYIINPFDLIPDILPGLGILDDAFLLGLCIKSVSNDVDIYKEELDRRRKDLSDSFGEV